ncbi:extracellular solute-binding protein [Enterovibrio paralichthyis]|uniref:extracellular solute-binding protein n=1 Tax=Enterovibrio paralichthyis TaxID=2853805 RepID=UPI001C463B41|nr:extracellular solute-binding protein [Enterovibrio paralichthyis]MBV7298342.1 extracellular solute-binding protein [Enterovibrio paralichthyis]
MTREELLRILDFTESTRKLVEDGNNLSLTDARWNIIAFVIRRHFEGKLLTITSIAMASNVPYATAMRRIGELIDEGMLLKRARTRTGKSFSFHPTEKMIAEFEEYAHRLKSLVGHTFGFSQGGYSKSREENDYYFGASYMGSRLIPYPSVMEEGIGYDRVIRILCPSDPTFKTLSDMSRNLNEFCGGKLEVVNLSLDALHDEVIENAKLPNSRYDIMAVDLPWFGEFVEGGIIRPLTEIIEQTNYRYSDYHTSAWKGSSYRSEQYGIPIQPTAELLFYRKDLFESLGLVPPSSTETLLECAKALHNIKPDMYSIILNCAQGTPVAHTFMQTMASFGQPVIDLPKIGDDFTVEEIESQKLRPRVDSEGGRAAAEFLMALLKYAHPSSLQCNWDQRIRLFSEGKAAMTYGWSIRAAMFEMNEGCEAHGKVGYTVNPPKLGVKPVSPIGGFSLVIPTNLAEDRLEKNWQMMTYLARPDLMKWYTLNGSFSSPRFSTSADPEVRQFSDIFETVDELERRGEIQNWPRPPVPEFNQIVAILGEEIHKMLRGILSVDDALSRAQQRIEALGER